MYGSEICAKGFFCVFSQVTKKIEKYVKNSSFFKWAPFWNLIFKKRNQLHFSEENYLNYAKKRHFFLYDNYIFPKEKNEQAVDPLACSRRFMVSGYSRFNPGGEALTRGMGMCGPEDPLFSRLSCRSQGSHFKQKSQFTRPTFEKIWKF